jgi:hypothetical protein
MNKCCENDEMVYNSVARKRKNKNGSEESIRVALCCFLEFAGKKFRSIFVNGA